jgi:hypothetical protein
MSPSGATATQATLPPWLLSSVVQACVATSSVPTVPLAVAVATSGGAAAVGAAMEPRSMNVPQISNKNIIITIIIIIINTSRVSCERSASIAYKLFVIKKIQQNIYKKTPNLQMLLFPPTPAPARHEIDAGHPRIVPRLDNKLGQVQRPHPHGAVGTGCGTVPAKASAVKRKKYIIYIYISN